MNPRVLGLPPYSKESALPFLFKVLSIRKALSVQAHPDRSLARRLHASRPDLYRDPNHKPEMTVALTPFDAMCSFRDLRSLQDHVSRLPELRNVVGSDIFDALLLPSLDDSSAKETFRTFYRALLNAQAESLLNAIEVIRSRLLVSHANAPDTVSPPSQTLPSGVQYLSAERVFLRLCQEYPGDVGVFSPFLLNTLRLDPGVGLFLAANEPHAYLSGDCVEIMATSDNVVRAGLTPKFKDVDTLVDMLTYKFGLPSFVTPRINENVSSSKEMEPIGLTTSSPASSAMPSKIPSAAVFTYTAPVPEFQLERVDLRSSTTSTSSTRTGSTSTETPPSSPPSSPPATAHATFVDLPPSPCASILLVTELARTTARTGAGHLSTAPSDAATDVLTDSLTATLCKPDLPTQVARNISVSATTESLANAPSVLTTTPGISATSGIAPGVDLPSHVALNPGQVWLLPAHASVRLSLRDTPAAAAQLFRATVNPNFLE